MIINPLIIIPSQLNELGEPKRQLADLNGHSMVVQSYKQIKQAGIGSIIVDCIDDKSNYRRFINSSCIINNF